jgi:predicted TPR repeat methyltransferase
MPSGYVRSLFDQYASKFEKALVDELGYRGPALLFKAVLGVRAPARKPALFRHAIDLGCGTGLAARAFAKEVDRFTGIDLSPRMLDRARSTGLYSGLEESEMLQALRGKPDAGADLIIAADAMVYVGDLVPLLREAARVLVAGGLLAFTAETHDGEGVVLGAGLRYAHGAAYLREAVDAAGLVLARLEHLSARNEDNAPVPGLVVVAANPEYGNRRPNKNPGREAGA